MLATASHDEETGTIAITFTEDHDGHQARLVVALDPVTADDLHRDLTRLLF